MTEKELLAMTKSGSTIKEEISKIPTIKLQLIDGSTYDVDGKVDAITGVIDQSTGSVSIRAIFPNKEHVLRSGGTANALIPYTMENVITIPQSATVEIQDKKFVYVLQPDNTVKYTEIMYNFMILFRMYLAGIAFILYARKSLIWITGKSTWLLPV